MKLKTLFILISLIFCAQNLFPQSNEELFWKAAKNNDVENLKSLLEKGVDVNSTTEYGATALTYAADKGNVEATIFLLENGADPNMRDLFYQSTPFLWVLYEGDKEIIKGMIAHGANINDESAISWIVQVADEEILNLMLQKGITNPGMFLYSFLKNNNLELSEILLNNSDIGEEDLTSCLLLVKALENKEAILLLEKYGAKLPVVLADSTSLDLNKYVGYFERSDGLNAKIDVDEKFLSVNFGTRPYKLIYSNDSVFTFLEYPNATINFNYAGGQIICFVYKEGDYSQKYIKIEEPEAAKPEVAEKKNSIDDKIGEIEEPLNWTSFRGNEASGIADGQYPPVKWDAIKGNNLKWKTYIPGLAHACPIIWEDKVFIVTVFSEDTTLEFREGPFGNVKYANDDSDHTWKIYCLDKYTGEIKWEKKAYEGVPKVKRHTYASHANSTPVTNGEYVVALYGSEGMICYDMDGNEQWRKDLGILDAGWFFDEETQWGHSSSPVIYKNMVIIQCDRSKDSYITAYDLASGKEVWYTKRDEISSWGTPTIYYNNTQDELITNATKAIRGYDPNTGEELWSLGPNSEITVATPVALDDVIYVTAGYPPVRPVYAIKAGGRGDISIPDSLDSGDFILWRNKRGGTYMPSPIAYNGYFYTLGNYGTLTCYDAKTGEQKYKERLNGGRFTASILAADGKLYCTSEDQGVFIIKAGPEFEMLTSNPVGEVCMATPAISEGMIFIRGQHHIFCISR